jgi:hypothetical protein
MDLWLSSRSARYLNKLKLEAMSSLELDSFTALIFDLAWLVDKLIELALRAVGRCEGQEEGERTR